MDDLRSAASSHRAPWRRGAGVAGMLLFLAMSPSPGAASAAPDTLTVADCVGLARRQAPDVRAAALDERAAAGDSTAESYNRRPDFHLSSSAWVAPDGWYDPAYTNLGEYTLQLGMDWTLGDGGRRSRARERARLDLQGTRARRLLATRDAGANAAALALRAVRLDETTDILAGARDRLDAIGSLVRAGVRAGTRSTADSIRLALAEEDADLDLEATAADRVATRLELLETLGRPLTDALVIRPGSEAPWPPPTEADSLALVDGAAHRQELALASIDEARARLDEIEARRRSAPEVAFTMDAGLAGTDLTRAVPVPLLDENPSATLADRLHRDLGASAAVTVRFPLLDAGRAPAAGARADALRAASLRHDAEATRQRREAMALLARWRTATERQRLADQAASRAEDHFLRTKSLYAAGATTLFDVLDALQLLKEARVRAAESKEDLRMVRFLVEDRR